jgi:DNA polymerase-3 subunit alpha
MGGMISAFKKLKTRSGTMMAFVTVEDMFGSIECVCFPKIYDRIRDFLENDKVVSLSGTLSIDGEKPPAIIVDKMTEFSLDNEKEQTQNLPQTAKEQAPVRVQDKPDSEKTLWLNVSDLEDEDIEELMETLTYYAGETKVIFVKNGKKMICSQRVTPNRALMAELAGFLAENCVKLT